MIHRSIGLTLNRVPLILDRPILLDWLVNEPYNVMGGFYKKLAAILNHTEAGSQASALRLGSFFG